MAIAWLAYLLVVGAALSGVLVFLCDGSKLQPTARETLIRRCDEQHAAIMRGDYNAGTYGKYPPDPRGMYNPLP